MLNNQCATNSHTEEISSKYKPIGHHWFYKNDSKEKGFWEQFSRKDSKKLEDAFQKGERGIIATDGGRCDVNVRKRLRTSIYWNSPKSEVRRCSWFYKGNIDGRFVPYTESIADTLELEYKSACENDEWHRKVDLDNGENIIFHAPDILVHFVMANTNDVWGNTPQTGTRPRVIKRGFDDFEIEDGETDQIDHLLFMVHGIGPRCDLKFRSLIEVVDEFRIICRQLVQSHYASSCEKGIANRIEVLPITWHDKLHSEETGIDNKLKSITLESIPRFRDFTNDTLVDILFYTSPAYSQTIITSVGGEMNRVYELFKKRNPNFKGSISMAGHSLGSLIIFDLLCHQKSTESELPSNEGNSLSDNDNDDLEPKKPSPMHRRMSRRISYMMSKNGTGQTQLMYPNLHFHPKAFFALGSPIGMFATIRGLDTLGENFALPTCPAFFNIFHPYDPVAYRIEALINPSAAHMRPYLIPHHKGRKRMHLELKETMVRVGTDIKQKFLDSLRNTWNSFYPYITNQAQIEQGGYENGDQIENSSRHRTISRISETEENESNLSFGILNQGRRIDYVLQEAPVEFFNEYIFALQSHMCYWESEDSMLIILKEIYESMGIEPDSQIPQQTMTIQPD